MKMNWKALIVLVLIVAISIWAVNLMRPRTYSADHLSFGVGNGTVTITNPSDEAIPVQLSSAGSRSYSLSSNIEGVSGRSTREGSGRDTTHSFAFDLPPGSSQFTIDGGTDVIFTADSGTQLTATVLPLSAGASRTTLIALIVAIVGSLYYISSTMKHRWIGILRGETPVHAEPVPAATSVHGQAAKSYGDNITRKTG